jgi:cell division protein FtsQ
MWKKLRNTKLSDSLKQLLAVVLFATVAVLLFSAVTLKKQREIQKVEINLKKSIQEHLIGQQYLVNLLHREFGNDLKNVPFEFIDLEHMEKTFEADDYIASCEVYLDKTGLLKIDVKERVPVLRVIGDRGGYYLDAFGSSVPLSDYYSARLPVVHETDFRLEDSVAVQSLIQLVTAINENTFMAALTDQIEIEHKNEFVIIPMLGKEKIKLGTSENIEEKFDRLRKFYRLKIGKGNWDKCQYVDVRFKDQVVCKELNKT